MFKSFTASDKNLPAKSPRSADPGAPAPPAPVQKAARYMLVGAILTAIWQIYWIVVTVAHKASLTGANGKPVTNSQVVASVLVTVVFLILISAIWVLVARLNQAGKSWARIAATVLFALWSFSTYRSIPLITRGDYWIVNIIIMLTIWLIGLAVIYLLWRPESTAFYKEQSAKLLVGDRSWAMLSWPRCPRRSRRTARWTWPQRAGTSASWPECWTACSSPAPPASSLPWTTGSGCR